MSIESAGFELNGKSNRIEVAVERSPEEIEGIVAEMITSAPVGLVSTEDVVHALGVMKIPEPEKYQEMIDRMIRLDREG